MNLVVLIRDAFSIVFVPADGQRQRTTSGQNLDLSLCAGTVEAGVKHNVVEVEVGQFLDGQVLCNDSYPVTPCVRIGGAVGLGNRYYPVAEIAVADTRLHPLGKVLVVHGQIAIVEQTLDSRQVDECLIFDAVDGEFLQDDAGVGKACLGRFGYDRVLTCNIEVLVGVEPASLGAVSFGQSLVALIPRGAPVGVQLTHLDDLLAIPSHNEVLPCLIVPPCATFRQLRVVGIDHVTTLVEHKTLVALLDGQVEANERAVPLVGDSLTILTTGNEGRLVVLSPLVNNGSSHQSPLVVMVHGAALVAATRLMIAEAGGVVNVDHQHNLILMIGFAGMLGNIGTIVKYVHRRSIATVEVVNMHISLSYGQEVHVITIIGGTVSSPDYLGRVGTYTGTTLIHLLNKEVGQMRVFVRQVGISLEIGLDTKLLTIGQRVRHQPAAETGAIGHVGPFIGIGVLGTCQTGRGVTESPVLVSSRLAEGLYKDAVVAICYFLAGREVVKVM